MSGWNGIFYNGIWTLGFDFLPTGTPAAGGVFTSVSGSSNVGSSFARFAGQGIQTGGGGSTCYLGRTLGVNLASMYVGFAFKTASLPAAGNFSIICSFYDTTGSQGQITLAYNSQGQMGFYTGNGSIAGGAGNLALVSGTSLSPTGTIIVNSYCFLEIFVTIDPSAGVLKLNVNNTSLLSFTGLNTRYTANSWTNNFVFGSNSYSGATPVHQFDDLYMLDTTGASPLNTFLGPGRIQTDGPTADSASGGLNAWSYTTPPGNDYGCCANIPANSAQYCYDSNPGDRMSFKFPALSTSKVFALNTWFSAEIDASGSRTIAAVFRSNSVDQVGPSPVSLASGYTYYNQPSTIDPNTSAAWASGTVAAAGSCEIGLELVS